jgi:uncharacterized protein
MKLHATRTTSLNTVTAYGSGYLEINAERHERALIVQPEAPLQHWPVEHFDHLATEHFALLTDFCPEFVLLGTGSRQRFPHPRLTAPLTSAGIGVEAMDSGAACRTYNILMAEGRKVLLAVLPPEPGNP